ncbi:hypothetical protein [Vibrio sp. TRT 29B02]|uniref:hypothetical protein n=1 Tax=Vibrio sp. TRT 29B02 TaxID=3418508 RepID=UPI003CF0359D
MLKNNKLNREKIEQEARLILHVAFHVAGSYSHSDKLRQLPSSPNLSFEFLWDGKKHSETQIQGDRVYIRFAFQDLFRFQKGDLFYYSESTELARKAIPCGYVSARAALCALISHEVAHAALFVTEQEYGKRPHNKAWLDLTIYLRERLLPVFDYSAERSYLDFIDGDDVLNFDWELLMSYIRNFDSMMATKPKKQGIRFHFRLVGAIIERLISNGEQKGLVILTDKLFKAAL